MNPHQLMIAVLEIETFSCSFTKFCKHALIGLLIPVSTADCERGFSSLKRIKTPLRNRLSSVIANHLMFISIEGTTLEEFDFDAACDLWAS